ncbi:hypothetical protein J6590_020838 [Homalodisca vitripennis]|nr:hypothetical protein J6590_020838 [Homalodisca vitripennis]
MRKSSGKLNPERLGNWQLAALNKRSDWPRWRGGGITVGGGRVNTLIARKTIVPLSLQEWKISISRIIIVNSVFRANINNAEAPGTDTSASPFFFFTIIAVKESPTFMAKYPNMQGVFVVNNNAY